MTRCFRVVDLRVSIFILFLIVFFFPFFLLCVCLLIRLFPNFFLQFTVIIFHRKTGVDLSNLGINHTHHDFAYDQLNKLGAWSSSFFDVVGVHCMPTSADAYLTRGVASASHVIHQLEFILKVLFLLHQVDWKRRN